MREMGMREGVVERGSGGEREECVCSIVLIVTK